MNHEHDVWVGRGVANVVRVTADGDQWATHTALTTLKHDAANECPPTPLLHPRQLASTEQSTKAPPQKRTPPPHPIVILADYKR